MNIRKYLLNIFYGFLIGVCMLVPGVSGGSIAVLLGIYDELLEATACVLSRFRKSIFSLSSVAVGGMAGFVSMAGVIGALLKSAPFLTIYFFMGTIIGGIVLTIFSKEGRKIEVSIPMIVLGVGAVLLLKFVPDGALYYMGGSVWIRFLIMIVAGLFLGAALILPGVSFSMTLMTLGIYEKFLSAVHGFDLMFLLPIAFATIFGVIVLSKLLLRFMKNCPKLCDSLILGFVIASVAELFPGIPQGGALLFCLLIGVLGFLLTFGSTAYIERKKNVKTVTSFKG